ncbi:hypothetical protein [Phytobacter massiliensis]|uniref:hypothetical protein n=1 Tax=Phytobacter massiliensis TaxID=1485952 RepID=UPI0002F73880|nr:hypothetical protein [Phytobacter massiliensis]
MAINENDLRKAGFTEREVENLHNRLTRTGGTMDELINALSRRLQVSSWLTVILFLIMLVAIFSGNRTHMISGGVSAVVVLLIAWCTLPPMLAWKARQLHKANSRQV